MPDVQVADFNSYEIVAALNAAGPFGGGTPTARALLYGFQYLIGLDESSDDLYVILTTDGAPNCSDDPTLTCDSGCATSVEGPCNHDEVCLDDQAVYARVAEYWENWGIPTYVLGMGGVVELWDEVLTGIAQHGGTGDYYAALSPQQLKDALQEIAAAATECTFDVDWDALEAGTSTNPSLVNVEADGIEVPLSEDCSDEDGWHWLDEDTIELCPGLCHDYKWGLVHTIRATFGCATLVE